MKWVLHVDGDGFFVSCELTRRPDLRGKPVVTGAERGIATALSYEAKALGLVRGTPIFKIRREFPQVVVLPSDFELYSMMAERMYSIVRRFSPTVEEYSIDECFAKIIFPTPGVGKIQELVKRVRDTLEGETGVSFSVGIASTKTLSKVASNWAKPHGATVLAPAEREVFLGKTPIGKVWGVGWAGKRKFVSAGVLTALDFAHKDETWVERHFGKPQLQTWLELQGISALPVSTEARIPKSIQRTRTFTLPSSDKNFLWTQLSKHAEEACMSARHQGLFTARASFFLKTQDFRYGSAQVEMLAPTNSPQEILARIATPFAELFDPERVYRATGISLFAFQEHTFDNLFGIDREHERLEKVYRSMDKLNTRYGRHTVFLASSLRRTEARPPAGGRASPMPQSNDLFLGETLRRHLHLPHLGVVN